jgi:hypothetical protein
VQASLFGHLPPCVDDGFANLRRFELEQGAWVEHGSEWLRGHEALFEMLLREVDFQAQQRVMYDRVVDVPRLMGRAPETGPAADLLRSTSALLSKRYGRTLEGVTASRCTATRWVA